MFEPEDSGIRLPTLPPGHWPRLVFDAPLPAQVMVELTQRDPAVRQVAWESSQADDGAPTWLRWLARQGHEPEVRPNQEVRMQSSLAALQAQAADMPSAILDRWATWLWTQPEAQAWLATAAPEARTLVLKLLTEDWPEALASALRVWPLSIEEEDWVVTRALRRGSAPVFEAVRPHISGRLDPTPWLSFAGSAGQVRALLRMGADPFALVETPFQTTTFLQSWVEQARQVVITMGQDGAKAQNLIHKHAILRNLRDRVLVVQELRPDSRSDRAADQIQALAVRAQLWDRYAPEGSMQADTPSQPAPAIRAWIAHQPPTARYGECKLTLASLVWSLLNEPFAGRRPEVIAGWIDGLAAQLPASEMDEGDELGPSQRDRLWAMCWQRDYLIGAQASDASTHITPTTWKNPQRVEWAQWQARDPQAEDLDVGCQRLQRLFAARDIRETLPAPAPDTIDVWDGLEQRMATAAMEVVMAWDEGAYRQCQDPSPLVRAWVHQVHAGTRASWFECNAQGRVPIWEWWELALHRCLRSKDSDRVLGVCLRAKLVPALLTAPPDAQRRGVQALLRGARQLLEMPLGEFSVNGFERWAQDDRSIAQIAQMAWDDESPSTKDARAWLLATWLAALERLDAQGVEVAWEHLLPNTAERRSALINADAFGRSAFGWIAPKLEAWVAEKQLNKVLPVASAPARLRL